MVGLAALTNKNLGRHPVKYCGDSNRDRLQRRPSPYVTRQSRYLHLGAVAHSIIIQLLVIVKTGQESRWIGGHSPVRRASYMRHRSTGPRIGHTPGERQYAAALGLYLDTLRASDLTYGARTSIIGAGDDLVRLLRAAISPGEAQSGREERTDAAGGEPRTPTTLGAGHRLSGECWLFYWAAQ